MKKGICFGSLPSSLPLRRRLELAKEFGIDGIEAPAFETQQEAEEVAEICADLGLEIHSVMGGTHWRLPLSATDEQMRQQGVEGIRHALHVAKWVGAECVLVVPAVVNEDVSYAAAWEISQKSIRELLPTAEELGVMMLIENVWNKFLLSPLEMRDYVDSFDHPLIGAYFDVGNIIAYGFPHHWIETLGSRIKRVHVKGFDANKHQFVPLLAGTIDWPRVVAALRGIGYDSYITAEVPPYKHFPETFIRHVAEALDAIVNA